MVDLSVAKNILCSILIFPVQVILAEQAGGAPLTVSKYSVITPDNTAVSVLSSSPSFYIC